MNPLEKGFRGGIMRIRSGGKVILGGFLGNLCDDLLQIRTDALLNERFPSAQRATLVSVSSLTFSLVMIVMSPLMGWLLS